MNELNSAQAREMLLFACNSMIARETELCSLDSIVGDGDHGITVSRGFSHAAKMLVELPPTSVSELFVQTGTTLSSAMGGASGPIFGSFFVAAGKAAAAKDTITTEIFGEMMNAGLQLIKKIGGAAEGDRTLVDALSPAAAALTDASLKKLALPEALRHALDAAEKGAEHTSSLLPKKGRARFLGERALGHKDAGAMSFYYLFKAFSDYVDGGQENEEDC